MLNHVTRENFCHDVIMYVILAILCGDSLIRGVNCGEMRQYCQFEHFNASCPNTDEVMMMERALYGRYQVGRCVKNPHYGVNCYNDVLMLTDRQCSGKRRCSIHVVDPNFVDSNAKTVCNGELKMYLEAQYTCVKVIQAQPHQCYKPGHVAIEATSGYISSRLTQDTRCGNSESPYRITLPKGQRVNITLLDFGLFSGRTQSEDTQRFSSSSSASSSKSSAVLPRRNLKSPPCMEYAVIREPDLGREQHLCSRHRRVAHVFESESNVVEIEISMTLPADTYRFLLHYEAVGCPNKQLPADMWVEYSGLHASIGCNNSAQPMWKLLCKNSVWVGPVGNCSKDVTGFDGYHWNGVALSTSMLVVLVILIAIIISIGILVIGVCHLRRKSKRRLEEMKQDMLDDPQLRVPEGYLREESNLYDQRPHACLYSTADTAGCNVAELAYLWDTTATPARLHTTATAGGGTTAGAGGKAHSNGGGATLRGFIGSGTYTSVPCQCPAIPLKEIQPRHGSVGSAAANAAAPAAASAAAAAAASSAACSVSSSSDNNTVTVTAGRKYLHENPYGAAPPHQGGAHVFSATEGAAQGGHKVTYCGYDAYDPDVIRANQINAKKSRGLSTANENNSNAAVAMCRQRNSLLASDGAEVSDCQSTS